MYSVLSDIGAAGGDDEPLSAMDALDLDLVDAGFERCRSDDCFHFAGAGRSVCEVCALSPARREVWVNHRAGIFGRPFAEIRPPHDLTALPDALRERVIKVLDNGATWLEPLRQYGAPSWSAAAQAFAQPSTSTDRHLVRQLEHLTSPDYRRTPSMTGSWSQQLAGDVIDLILTAVSFKTPRPQAGSRNPYVIAANMLLGSHWDIALSMRCGATKASDVAAVAPILRWTRAAGLARATSA